MRREEFSNVPDPIFKRNVEEMGCFGITPGKFVEFPAFK
jgi:hypothetical protein